MQAEKYYNGREKYTNLDLATIKNAKYVDRIKVFGNISLNVRT